MTTLPCGCTRGEFLCPTAVALWERSSWALHEGKQTEAARLRELYEAHFQQDADTPPQETAP